MSEPAQLRGRKWPRFYLFLCDFSLDFLRTLLYNVKHARQPAEKCFFKKDEKTS